MTGLGIAVAFLLLLWWALLHVPFRRPVGLHLIAGKSLASGYVPFIAAVGLAPAVVGAVFGSWWIAVPAAVGALVVIVRVGSAWADLSGALGTDWQDRIPAERRKGMVRRWWAGRLGSGPEHPGAGVVPEGLRAATVAVRIGAAPGRVWPWLAPCAQVRADVAGYNLLMAAVRRLRRQARPDAVTIKITLR